MLSLVGRVFVLLKTNYKSVKLWQSISNYTRTVQLQHALKLIAIGNMLATAYSLPRFLDKNRLKPDERFDKRRFFILENVTEMDGWVDEK